MYYHEFRWRHGEIPEPKIPEIGVKAGSVLTVPLVVTHGPNAAVEITVTVPTGWKVLNGAGRLQLPAEKQTALNMDIVTPELSKAELKGAQPTEIVVTVAADGVSPSRVRLRVQLKASALPQ